MIIIYVFIQKKNYNLSLIILPGNDFIKKRWREIIHIRMCNDHITNLSNPYYATQ